MRVAITGASGFVGTALTASLRSDGHDVVRLVRRAPRAPDEVQWDPMTGMVDLAGLAGTDGLVNLAGAGVGDRRWTQGYKRKLYDSHVGGTRVLAEAATALEPRPHVIIGQGGINYYGNDCGDTMLDEDAPAGQGFLATAVKDTEAALDPARQAGIRVVSTRSGIVMDKSGSTLGRRLLPLFRLGLGARLGNGRQWWSIVSLDDAVRAITFLLVEPTASGAYNVTAPVPSTNRDVTAALARAVHRPALLAAPAPAIRLVLGEFADAVLGSVRAVPARLQAAGFEFAHRTADEIFAAALD